MNDFLIDKNHFAFHKLIGTEYADLEGWSFDVVKLASSIVNIPTFVFHAPLQFHNDLLASEISQERLGIHNIL